MFWKKNRCLLLNWAILLTAPKRRTADSTVLTRRIKIYKYLFTVGEIKDFWRIDRKQKINSTIWTYFKKLIEISYLFFHRFPKREEKKGERIKQMCISNFFDIILNLSHDKNIRTINILLLGCNFFSDAFTIKM